jgi:hypothetical protein
MSPVVSGLHHSCRQGSCHRIDTAEEDKLDPIPPPRMSSPLPAAAATSASFLHWLFRQHRVRECECVCRFLFLQPAKLAFVSPLGPGSLPLGLCL